MNKKHGVLDYARPTVIEARLRHVTRLCIVLIVASAIGGLVGVAFSRVVLGPTYQSIGRIYLDHHPTSKILLAASNRVKSSAIVSAALSIARQRPEGASLPSSASGASGHLIVSFDRGNEALEVSYSDRDPQAAVCVVSEIISAYAASPNNPNGARWPVRTVSRPLACEILPVGDADNPCGLCGVILGIVSFACFMLFAGLRSKELG